MTNVNAFISFINDVRMWDKFLNIKINLHYKYIYIYNTNLYYKYLLHFMTYRINKLE